MNDNREKNKLFNGREAIIMLSPNVIKVGKAVGKFIVGVGLPLAANYFEKKQLRAEITKIATEIVDKAMKQS